MTVQPIRIELPYGTPPLNANQRLHWAAKARITSQLRRECRLLYKVAKLPRKAVSVEMSLHYAPARNGRRDADNLVPTLKVCADALVDHGTVPDDTPEYMTKHMPVIHPKHTTGQGHVWLELTIKERTND